VVGYFIENFVSVVYFVNICKESQSPSVQTPGTSWQEQLRLGAALARLWVCPELLHTQLCSACKQLQDLQVDVQLLATFAR